VVRYLDWPRVLALAGVFGYHTLRPFDTGDWHVKDDQRSQLLSDVLTLIGSRGLPLFFLVAGASTYLALRRRTALSYVRERLLRLAVPLVEGWACSGRGSAGGFSPTTPSPRASRCMTNSKVSPDRLQPHSDLLAEFPFAGPPHRVAVAAGG
jgi:Acyltransferase family